MARGYAFQEPEAKNYTATKKYSELPETIGLADDSITKEIITCAHEGKCTHGCATAFRITKEELEFYKRMNIPLPHKCHNCRHYERIAYKNPLELWKRTCDCVGKNSKNAVYANNSAHDHGENKCGREFETSYAPEKLEIIYREHCYQLETA